jgi:hypothetical protein
MEVSPIRRITPLENHYTTERDASLPPPTMERTSAGELRPADRVVKQDGGLSLPEQVHV